MFGAHGLSFLSPGRCIVQGKETLALWCTNQISIYLVAESLAEWYCQFKCQRQIHEKHLKHDCKLGATLCHRALDSPCRRAKGGTHPVPPSCSTSTTLPTFKGKGDWFLGRFRAFSRSAALKQPLILQFFQGLGGNCQSMTCQCLQNR